MLNRKFSASKSPTFHILTVGKHLKMKKYIQLTLFVLTIVSCGQGQMKTAQDSMDKFEKFKAKDKFVEDSDLYYPGIGDPALKSILTEKINKAAEDFEEVAQSENPTDKKYQEKIGVGLRRFSEIYIDLDTEDRERVCSYFEELMDIVGLESSDGQLNEFMYGFDPTNRN